MPTFDLNNAIVQKAESYGFDFALSMIKLNGDGGASHYWDYNLESFTVMAGLAATTSRIQLFASVAVLKIENDRPIVDAMPERARVDERVHRERSGRVPVNALAET